MKEWTKVNILKVAKIVSGSTPKGIDKQFDESGEIPFFRVRDMNTIGNEKWMKNPENLVNTTTANKLNLKVCKEGTIIFPKRGASIFTNKKRVLSFPSAFDLNIMGLVPNANVDKNFFFYWFSSIDFRELADGSSVPQLNNKHIVPLKIPLPSLSTQKKIAAILDEADRLRQLNQQVLDKYDALSQSVFLEMFGEYFKNQLVELKQVVTFSQGQQFSIDKQSLDPKEGFARFLRIVDFTQGDDLRYVPNENYKYYVNKNDIVIVRYGASAGFVGTNKEGVLANNLFKINFDRNQFNHTFLFFVFKDHRFKRFVEKEAFGAAMPALSFKVMNRFKTCVPPLTLQTQFADRIKSIETQKSQAQAALAKSEDLFNSLLQRAFKGELVK